MTFRVVVCHSSQLTESTAVPNNTIWTPIFKASLQVELLDSFFGGGGGTVIWGEGNCNNNLFGFD